jgi:hypothetical protein
MGREQPAGPGAATGGPAEPRARKSVRWAECPGPCAGGPGSPVSMLQALVPHLPGIDPEALYVISGPFPQYEAGSGAANMVIMATPVPAGVTVVAVPAGPPPAPGARGVLTGAPSSARPASPQATSPACRSAPPGLPARGPPPPLSPPPPLDPKPREGQKPTGRPRPWSPVSGCT